MKYTLSVLLLMMIISIQAQPLQLEYFLPPTTYTSGIKHPGEFIGHLPGEWHLTHDQVLYYSQYLAESSNRVIYQEYARSHENKPLFHLIISHPDNINNLEQILENHQQLADPDKSSSVDISHLPAIVNLGYNVHGNEQSSVGASVYVAYYLTSGNTPYLDSLLRNTVVLIDPCLNPDGMNRFTTWVNMHKGKKLVSDPASREFNEPWPGSRTNHYWFDLNRDWLPLVHPESRGRIEQFQKWLPNIVSDYHEMGTHATYFFQPGVESRTNPLTPDKNIDLTAKVAEYHAKYLDSIGTLYYSGEGFDDFYYGKGSTYPDVHGSIGILFEQASSRGHLQESRHGLVSYPYTIRNQIYASLSTLEAALRMRTELLNWKKTFFTSAIQDADRYPVKAFVFGDESDPTKLVQFLDLLIRHNIEVYYTNTKISYDGKNFPGGSYLVPLKQRQHRLIRSIFETTTEFKDSVFYDVSTWTIPLAMNIPYAAMDTKAFQPSSMGGRVTIQDFVRMPERIAPARYAYLIEWKDYFAPALLYQLLENGAIVKATEKSFTIKVHGEEKTFQPGTLLIPIQWQKKSSEEVQELMQKMSNTFGIPITAIQSGKALRGVDLGSPRFDVIKTPKIALFTGSGMSSYECGEIWHTLDHKYNIKVTLLDIQQFGRLNWSDYTHLIIPGGNPGLSDSNINQLKEWVRSGGTIIASGSGNNWLRSNDIIAFETESLERNSDTLNKDLKKYEDYSTTQAAGRLSGAIFSMDIDSSHPLFFGYNDTSLALFKRGTTFVKVSKNKYATPAKYSTNALLSGYVPKLLQSQLSGHAAVMVHGYGSGKVISFYDNPLFRGFWLGTHKMYMNAIFFGPTISRGTIEFGVRGEEE